MKTKGISLIEVLISLMGLSLLLSAMGIALLQGTQLARNASYYAWASHGLHNTYEIQQLSPSVPLTPLPLAMQNALEHAIQRLPEGEKKITATQKQLEIGLKWVNNRKDSNVFTGLMIKLPMYDEDSLYPK
jgi:Tfp pilus assembly protein PilV